MSEQLATSGTAIMEANAAETIRKSQEAKVQAEAAAQAAERAVAEKQARDAAIEARRNSQDVVKLNDEAHLEIFGTNGQTKGLLDPSTGKPLVRPVKGHIQEIVDGGAAYPVHDNQYTRKVRAEQYKNQVLELLDEGFELCQAKLIMDWRELRQDQLDDLSEQRMEEDSKLPSEQRQNLTPKQAEALVQASLPLVSNINNKVDKLFSEDKLVRVKGMAEPESAAVIDEEFKELVRNGGEHGVFSQADLDETVTNTILEGYNLRELAKRQVQADRSNNRAMSDRIKKVLDNKIEDSAADEANQSERAEELRRQVSSIQRKERERLQKNTKQSISKDAQPTPEQPIEIEQDKDESVLEDEEVGVVDDAKKGSVTDDEIVDEQSEVPAETENESDDSPEEPEQEPSVQEDAASNPEKENNVLTPVKVIIYEADAHGKEFISMKYDQAGTIVSFLDNDYMQNPYDSYAIVRTEDGTEFYIKGSEAEHIQKAYDLRNSTIGDFVGFSVDPRKEQMPVIKIGQPWIWHSDDGRRKETAPVTEVEIMAGPRENFDIDEERLKTYTPGGADPWGSAYNKSLEIDGETTDPDVPSGSQTRLSVKMPDGSTRSYPFNGRREPEANTDEQGAPAGELIRYPIDEDDWGTPGEPPKDLTAYFDKYHEQQGHDMDPRSRIRRRWDAIRQASARRRETAPSNTRQTAVRRGTGATALTNLVARRRNRNAQEEAAREAEASTTVRT